MSQSNLVLDKFKLDQIIIVFTELAPRPIQSVVDISSVPSVSEPNLEGWRLLFEECISKSFKLRPNFVWKVLQVFWFSIKKKKKMYSLCKPFLSADHRRACSSDELHRFDLLYSFVDSLLQKSRPVKCRNKDSSNFQFYVQQWQWQ